MKRNRFTDEWIISILKEHEGVTPVSKLCRKNGLGGMEVSEAKRLRTLEDENTKLKRLLADAMLDNAASKHVLGKNVWSAPSLRGVVTP